MAFVKVWLHTVWSTKKRERILDPQKLNLICAHIRSNALIKDFYILELNGYLDHMHCLMSLRADWSVAKQMQMIKGESAHWINQNVIFQKKFEWADEYFASSVSEDKLPVVRNYIRNQEAHHRRISFDEEYQYFLKAFGFGQG